MSLPTLKLLPRTDSDGRALFQLEDDYHYQLGPGSVITVPAGYVTNFGTIPQFMGWFVQPAQLREAAIVHDWMCNEKFTDDETPIFSGYSRWMADAVLYEAMARIGFRWFKRAMVFAAVRAAAIVSGSNKWPKRPEELRVDEK